MKLVVRGMDQMEDQSFDLAASTFRDAINVDTTNGVAYYYLASVYAALYKRDQALGLLDKAESLLSGDPEWMKKIEELRYDLSIPKKSSHPSQQPVDL